MSKSVREIAYDILCKIESDKAYSNLAIDSAVKMYNPDSTDCAFISRVVYGVIERKITLDYIINQYLNQPIKKLKAPVLVALRLGAYQIVFMDKIPDSAAVNETVSIIKNSKFSFSSGLVNAVLRKISINKDKKFDTLSGDELTSVVYSVPEEIVKFLNHHYGNENTEQFLKASLLPKKIYIRANNVKISNEGLIKELEAEGVTVKTTYLKNAFEIDFNGAVYNLSAYKKGYFHVEDLSSQLCVEALESYPGCTAIDVCAAPGGKTFTIAENMNNTGELISCDIYPQRTDLIKNGADRLGLSCVKATVNDASVFNETFPLADRVLCDVPCSGLGIIGKKPEIKYKSLDDTKSLLPIQKEILNVSSKYVKSGGRLVYSTCSVNPNENRKICDAFLSENTDFQSVKALPDVERTVDEGDYLTLFPHKNNCDGFFVAVFVRK